MRIAARSGIWTCRCWSPIPPPEIIGKKACDYLRSLTSKKCIFRFGASVQGDAADGGEEGLSVTLFADHRTKGQFCVCNPPAAVVAP